MLDNKRLDNIDLLKALAIIEVVLIHYYFIPLNFLENPVFKSYFGYLLRLCIEGVPIFAMINGYLLFIRKFEIKKHIKKMIKIFLLIYVWNFIYLVLEMFRQNSLFSVRDLILQGLNLNIMDPTSGPLWFLQALLQVYLLFPIFKFVFDNSKSLYKYLFVVVLLFSVGINFIELICDLLETFFGMQNIGNAFNSFFSQYNPFSKASFLCFFLLGGYIVIIQKKFKEKQFQKKWVILGIGSIILGFVYAIVISWKDQDLYPINYNYSTIFELGILMLLFTITINFRNKNKLTNFLCSIGKNSFGIYLFHFPIILFLKHYNLFSYTNNLFFKCGTYLLIVLLSYLFTLFLSKIPFIQKIQKI